MSLFIYDTRIERMRRRLADIARQFEAGLLDEGVYNTLRQEHTQELESLEREIGRGTGVEIEAETDNVRSLRERSRTGGAA